MKKKIIGISVLLLFSLFGLFQAYAAFKFDPIQELERDLVVTQDDIKILKGEIGELDKQLRAKKEDLAFKEDFYQRKICTLGNLKLQKDLPVQPQTRKICDFLKAQ